MAVLLIICFSWARLKSPKLPVGTLTLLVLLVAISTWFHGVPHLFLLPFLAFLLARNGWLPLGSPALVAVGVILGASLTGHPFLFI